MYFFALFLNSFLKQPTFRCAVRKDGEGGEGGESPKSGFQTLGKGGGKQFNLAAAIAANAVFGRLLHRRKLF